MGATRGSGKQRASHRTLLRLLWRGTRQLSSTIDTTRISAWKKAGSKLSPTASSRSSSPSWCWRSRCRHGADFASLQAMAPIFLAYVLSFVNVGIFWNNHHHMLHATKHVDGTRAVGKSVPVVLAVAGSVRDPLDGRDASRGAADRSLWRRARRRGHRISAPRTRDRRAQRPKLCARDCGRLGHEGVGVASRFTPRPFRSRFVDPRIAIALYVVVALMWFIPDRRIEAKINAKDSERELSARRWRAISTEQFCNTPGSTSGKSSEISPGPNAFAASPCSQTAAQAAVKCRHALRRAVRRSCRPARRPNRRSPDRAARCH